MENKKIKTSKHFISLIDYRDKLTSIFSVGHPRSLKAKKNILYSLLLKGISIVVGLIYVPLLLGYLGQIEYGLWLTISSVVGWVSFFDIGLGNGLRNKFAEALAKQDKTLARTYLSTTYALLALIFTSLILIFFLINTFINWNSIFNIDTRTSSDLNVLMLLVFTFFCLRFIFQLIGVVLFADQRPALANSFNPISNLISLIMIVVLKQLSKSSLLYVGTIISCIPVLLYIVISIYFYKREYKLYSPSLKFIDFKFSKSLLSLGIKFFIIQIAGIVIFSSTNFIIIQLFQPEDVTKYNIAFKYFSVITMFFGIILTPLWSATTEAFAINDFKWIKTVMNKLKNTAIYFAILAIFMLASANWIYKLWVGINIEIPFLLSVTVFIYVTIYLFSSPYSSFLNGVGKIKLNFYLVVFQAVTFLPYVYLFTKYLNLGVAGIIIASIVSELPVRISQPIQYLKIINNKATGIWNK